MKDLIDRLVIGEPLYDISRYFERLRKIHASLTRKAYVFTRRASRLAGERNPFLCGQPPESQFAYSGLQPQKPGPL